MRSESKMERLPVPEIREETEFQHSFKQAYRRDDSRLRPPKLKHRFFHDSNCNRSSQLSSSSSCAQAISFGDNGELREPDTQPLSPHYDRQANESYFEQCFVNLSKIGEGSFGEVFKVRSKEDDHMYAVKMSKQLFRSSSYRHERLEEVRRYQQLTGHANCVQFYRAWEQDDRLYMQMELCRESLESYLVRERQIPEPKIWSILLDLLLAVKSLHDLNLIHLDIKLDNVLIGDDEICKLADFGLVIDVQDANVQATEGDSRYMAPEIMSGQFTKAADIFSLGIAMLELSCCLELPSNGPLWQQLRSGKLPEDFIQAISEDLRSVIKGMMAPNPLQRPTVDDLLCHKTLEALLRQRQRWVFLGRIKRSVFNIPHTISMASVNLVKCMCSMMLNVLNLVTVHNTGLLEHAPSTPLIGPAAPPIVITSAARTLDFSSEPEESDEDVVIGPINASTPIRGVKIFGRRLTKSPKLSESKARGRIDFVSSLNFGDGGYNDDDHVDNAAGGDGNANADGNGNSMMFECTPTKRTDTMFASTPLNHNKSQLLRTRNLSKPAFNLMDEDDDDGADMFEPNVPSVLGLEMKMEESHGVVRKSFDLSTARAKKLFLNDDYSD